MCQKENIFIKVLTHSRAQFDGFRIIFDRYYTFIKGRDLKSDLCKLLYYIVLYSTIWYCIIRYVTVHWILPRLQSCVFDVRHMSFSASLV